MKQFSNESGLRRVKHAKPYIQRENRIKKEYQRQLSMTLVMAVRDNYKKVVIAMSTNSTASVEGIKIVRLIDFLLE